MVPWHWSRYLGVGLSQSSLGMLNSPLVSAGTQPGMEIPLGSIEEMKKPWRPGISISSQHQIDSLVLFLELYCSPETSLFYPFHINLLSRR